MRSNVPETFQSKRCFAYKHTRILLGSEIGFVCESVHAYVNPNACWKMSSPRVHVTGVITRH